MIVNNRNIINDHLLSNEIVSIIKKYNYIHDIYICGGYLRNLLMGIDVKDIDVFVNCDEVRFKKFLEYLRNFGTIEYGQYGSPRFYYKNNKIQYVDIVPFYNFIVGRNKVTNVNELLDNFDFTANALAWNIHETVLIDPLNGQKDIHDKIIRAVRLDFPEKQVSSSIDLSAVSVFWFRLLHYQNKLNFTFERKTQNWIVKNKWRFKDINTFKKYFFSPNISDEYLQIITR